MQIEPLYFIISIFITMFILYVQAPKPEIIVKYPNIKEEISDTYIDDQGVCYRYHRVEIDD